MHTRDIHKILLTKIRIKQQSLINTVGKCIRTELTKKTKNQKNTRFNVSHCQELTFFNFFFSTCQALETWFELSRVKLFRNDLKGNNIYFELAGGSGSGKSLLRQPLFCFQCHAYQTNVRYRFVHVIKDLAFV